MSHNDDNTVLQAGSEELPLEQGDPGNQGTPGLPGTPGINTNLLTIKGSYIMTTPTSPFTPVLSLSYIVEQGTRFNASGTFTVNDLIVGTASSMIGQLTGFLVNPADAFTAEVNIDRVELNSGVIGDTQDLRVKMELFELTNDSIKWRVVNGKNERKSLSIIAGSVLDVKEIHFSIIITAINT